MLHKRRLKFPIIILFFFISLQTWSQSLEIKGVVKEGKKNLSGVTVKYIEKGRVEDEFVTTENGKILYKLGLKTEYIVEFSKEGYVTKKLQFLTDIPNDSSSRNSEFTFVVELFKPQDNTNVGIYNNPVVIS